MVVYSYLIFSCASPELRLGQDFKQVIYFVRMAATAVYMLVMAIFLLQPDCGHPALKLAGILYGTAVMILFPYDWYSTQFEREREQFELEAAHVRSLLDKHANISNVQSVQTRANSRHNSITYTASG